MNTLTVRTLRGSGEMMISSTALGKGGEGEVFAVQSHTLDTALPQANDLVAKMYHDASLARQHKLVAMVKSPPESDSVAWPLGILLKNGKFCGYVMQKLSQDTLRQWSDLAHSRERRKNSPTFSVLYAITSSLNLATAMGSVHDAKHRLGDVLNESNVFVGSDATVMLVDTDSAHITTDAGKVFRCEVGKPEYVAPEMVGKPLREQDRTVASDVFAAAVMVFQMLTGGAHPTDGIRNDGGDSTVSERILAGVIPTLREETTYRPVPRIPSAAIPTRLQTLVMDSMQTNPKQRPSVDTFLQILEDVLTNLQQCEKQDLHYFDSRDGACGWCLHAKSGQPDVWTPESMSNNGNGRKQRSLAPVPFTETSITPQKAPRRAVQPTQHAPQYHQPVATRKPNVAGSASAPPMPQPYQPSATPPSGATPGATPYPSPTGAYPQQQQVMPEKIKGKMTVRFADGTYGPRPSLGAVFRQSPRLGFEAIAIETPSLFHFWWSAERKTASIVGILAGVFVTLGILAGGAWYLTGWYHEHIPDYGWLNAATFGSWACLGVAGLAVIILGITALVHKHRNKGHPRENTILTFFRFIAVGIGYILALPILILVIILQLLSFFVNANSRSRW